MNKITLPHIPYHSTRGQCMIMLLFSLRELRVSVSKREAIQHVFSQKHFNIADEDTVPYASQAHEPRWHTLIAYSRKDCVRRGWIFNDETDAWGITREGIHRLDLDLIKFRLEHWKSHHCYLWTPKFKSLMDPNYYKSAKDTERPPTIYDDAPGAKMTRRLMAEYKLCL